MTLEKSLDVLVERATRQSGNLETEEATKQALVMPFYSGFGF